MARRTTTTWATTTNPSALAAGTPIRVKLQVDYDRVSWLPARFFLGNGTKVEGVSVMRKE